MKVTIINPEQVENIFYWWGETAKVCYNTSDKVPSEKVGMHCFNAKHFSGSRSQYILFKIEDCPRFTIDQLVRHEQGVMKNVQSFRYVNKDDFNYEIPKEILKEPILVEKYKRHMENTISLYEDIQSYVNSNGFSKERANEQARYVLPMSTYSSVVVGMDIEALIHLMNVRLCTRTEDTFRRLAIMMRDCVLEILPELSDYLVPNCKALLWCPEGKSSCGAYPTKSELMDLITQKTI